MLGLNQCTLTRKHVDHTCYKIYIDQISSDCVYLCLLLILTIQHYFLVIREPIMAVLLASCLLDYIMERCDPGSARLDSSISLVA